MKKNVICPYCLKEAEWLPNKEKYGKNLGKSYMFWWCRSCDASVGCHSNSKKPLGTMANKELRDWRIKAHASFDPIWEKGWLARPLVYRELARKVGLTQNEVHIGSSDIDMCKRIIEVSKSFYGIRSNPLT